MECPPYTAGAFGSLSYGPNVASWAMIDVMHAKALLFFVVGGERGVVVKMMAACGSHLKKTFQIGQPTMQVERLCLLPYVSLRARLLAHLVPA